MASVATNVTAFDVCVTQTAEMYTFTALVTESTLVVRYDVFLCNGTLAHSLEKAMLQLSRAFFKCIMMEVTRMSCDSRRQKWILSVSYCVGPQNNQLFHSENRFIRYYLLPLCGHFSCEVPIRSNNV